MFRATKQQQNNNNTNLKQFVNSSTKTLAKQVIGFRACKNDGIAVHFLNETNLKEIATKLE
jgi:hypothetical protein